MKHKKFQRYVEDFTCVHCSARVQGNGYTNHCPNCLYSKHVDINPGDRAETCHGLLQPIGLEQKGGEWVILHQCQKCSAQKRCKTVEGDIPAVLKLAKELAERKAR